MKGGINRDWERAEMRNASSRESGRNMGKKEKCKQGREEDLGCVTPPHQE